MLKPHPMQQPTPKRSKTIYNMYIKNKEHNPNYLKHNNTKLSLLTYQGSVEETQNCTLSRIRDMFELTSFELTYM